MNKSKYTCPTRYSVARFTGRSWEFYPCRYIHYRDAAAAVDFMPGPGWRVIDLFYTMTPEQRMLHTILSDECAEEQEYFDTIKIIR